MMQKWFKKAKLGIFLHWGIYAVDGMEASWPFYNGQVSYEDYMKQLDGFTAANYDPDYWADLFYKAGAKYAVLTAKHHDGVSLWDTKVSDFNVVKKSPAGRDLIKPYCEALRAKGLNVGIYFSLLDWSHPDYRTMDCHFNENPFANPVENEEPERWENFRQFMHAQLTELLTQNGTVDLLWFDGAWERQWDVWNFDETYNLLLGLNKNLMVNNRLGPYGDFSTPEQGIPTQAPDEDWEFCMTINDTWGYDPRDKNFKTPRQLIRIFSECISMGGNLLLNVGPKEDGTIEKGMEKSLLEMGEWIHKNAEAIYDTGKGLPPGLFYGASTISEDRKNLYLFYYDRPWDEVVLKGVINNIKKVSILGGEELSFKTVGGAAWVNVPGITYITLPEQLADKNATVIKVELDEPLKIYLGEGKIVDSN